MVVPLIIVVEDGNTFKVIDSATICVVIETGTPYGDTFELLQLIPTGATFAFGTTEICAPILNF